MPRDLEAKRAYAREHQRLRREARRADPELAAADRAYQARYRREHRVERAAKDKAFARRHGLRIRLQRKGLPVVLADRVAAVTACEICGGPPDGAWKKLNIDHCHVTGTFRGVLCSCCNNGLGLFKDRIDVLQSAIRYLQRAAQEQSHAEG